MSAPPAPPSSCGKRPRTQERRIVKGDEPLAKKVARLDEEAVRERPVAPKLADYMAPGDSEETPEEHDGPSSPRVATAAAATDQVSMNRAPDNGLLPDGAFAQFVIQHPSVHPSRRTILAARKAETAASPQANDAPNKEASKPCVFGKDWDPALNVAIRDNATEAALDLLERGASLQAENAKGVTPLILAAQKGNYTIAKELLRRGAAPDTVSMNGSTAVLQAAHFGHLHVLELLLQNGGNRLMEVANFNHTTPLMRAAQEGHQDIVRLLLEQGAQVNRRNRVQMTALMLASQRGHAQVSQMLIDYGADLDAMTNQDSTSLLLACKRGNLEVVRVLVTAGCELCVKDSRGRTAREVAQRRDLKELVELLDSSVQIHLMQREGRRQRSSDMIRMYNLLQQERAFVQGEEDSQFSIHQAHTELEKSDLPYHLRLSSTQALLRTMTLPAPLVESITRFLPLPHFWPKRMSMLTKRAVVNPDAAVTSALDLIDEVLEEGGFLEACDAAQVTPPTHFGTWSEWKAFGRQRGQVAAEQADPRERPNVTTSTVPSPRDPKSPTFVELRRQVGFLQILANRTTMLARVLGAPPYNMPNGLIQQLITSSDVASLARRMGSQGVHFDSTVAMDLVMLISRLCSWYWRERESVVNV